MEERKERIVVAWEGGKEEREGGRKDYTQGSTWTILSSHSRIQMQ